MSADLVVLNGTVILIFWTFSPHFVFDWTTLRFIHLPSFFLGRSVIFLFGLPTSFVYPMALSGHILQTSLVLVYSFWNLTLQLVSKFVVIVLVGDGSFDSSTLLESLLLLRPVSSLAASCSGALYCHASTHLVALLLQYISIALVISFSLEKT